MGPLKPLRGARLGHSSLWRRVLGASAVAQGLRGRGNAVALPPSRFIQGQSPSDASAAWPNQQSKESSVAWGTDGTVAPQSRMGPLKPGPAVTRSFPMVYCLFLILCALLPHRGDRVHARFVLDAFSWSMSDFMETTLFHMMTATRLSIGLTALLALQSAFASSLDYSVSWVGNSFSGASNRWVQNFFIHTGVQPDGTVNTWSHWDEGGRKFGVYKDGDAIGNTNVNPNSLVTRDKSGRDSGKSSSITPRRSFTNTISNPRASSVMARR